MSINYHALLGGIMAVDLTRKRLLRRGAGLGPHRGLGGDKAVEEVDWGILVLVAVNLKIVLRV